MISRGLRHVFGPVPTRRLGMSLGIDPVPLKRNGRPDMRAFPFGADYDPPARMYDLVQQLAIPDTEVLDRFGVDVVDLGHLMPTSPGWWKDWTLPDGSAALVPHWYSPVEEP